MRGYEEYEDLDEYEDDEQEDEAVEYADAEVGPPSKEELDYLELRKRLKESIRRQMKKESGSASSNSREKIKTASYDNYGSFFGPSQPVIAQRVIQESKSLLENHLLLGNATKSQTQKSKQVCPSNGRSRPPPGSIPPPKLINQQKLKAETLKHARDYSFLLSDNAELPVPSNQPPPRLPSAPNSEARSANVLSKNRQQPMHNNGSRQVPKSLSSGSGQGRHMASKGGSQSSKPPAIKLHPSASKQVINGGYRKEQMELGRVKAPIPSAKPHPAEHIKKKPVVKQQPTKRRLEEHNDYEAQNISGLIRGLFKYNPNKYANEDDDSDMEANYDDIMREERRSAKIAKKEDEEELMKIEEEERCKRMRRLKKQKV